MPPQQSKAPDFIPADPDFIPATEVSGAAERTPQPSMSLIRRGQNAFDAAATPEPIRPSSSIGGMTKSALNDLGAGITGMAAPLVHPLAFAKSTQPHGAWETLGGPAAVAIDRLAAPFMKQEGESGSDYGSRVVGQAVSMLPQALGAKMAPELPEAVKPYRSAVVPAAETSAERLAQAILPQEGVTPNNVRAIMREAPHVREYAQRTNNPLRTVPEGMKAAEGVANEGLEHYRQNFLGPNVNQRVSMKSVPEYRGPVSGEGAQTTLGDIDKRIGDINDLIRGSLRTARSGGQELTAAEKLGLDAEAGKLRQILYRELSNRSGVSPGDIQNLREGYGGQFAIKNALESGHYGRLTRAGQMSQGASGVPLSKPGIIDALITNLRGGPEAIANRQFRSRMSAFEPQAPNYPTPNPPGAPPSLRPPLWADRGIEPGQPPVMEAQPDVEGAQRIASNIASRNAARDATASENRALATREFLRQNETTQTAQDLAAQRAARVAGFREARNKLAEAARKSSGETRRNLGRENFR